MLLSDRKWSDEYLEDFQIPLALLVFQAQASCSHATHGTSAPCPETRVCCFLMHVRKPCFYIFSKLIWKVSRETPSLTKRKYGKVAHKSITPMSRRAAPNCFPPSLTTAKVPPEETLVKNKMYVKFLIGKNGNECPVCDLLLNDTGMCLQQNLMNV